jgi:hypothetical protein
MSEDGKNGFAVFVARLGVYGRSKQLRTEDTGF